MNYAVKSTTYRFRFEMSSPESLPRDTDFGYEVIEEEKKKTTSRGNQADDDASSVSVAEHYKGTPPLRVKKKKMPYKSDKTEPVSYNSAKLLIVPLFMITYADNMYMILILRKHYLELNVTKGRTTE